MNLHGKNVSKNFEFSRPKFTKEFDMIFERQVNQNQKPVTQKPFMKVYLSVPDLSVFDNLSLHFYVIFHYLFSF